MPELPEVETVVRYLRPNLEGETICRLEFLWPKTAATPDLPDKARGRMIQAVRRRGKFIWLELEKGNLLVHLRMTGHLTFTPPEPLKHITAKMELDSGRKLYLRDTRKFARIYWAATAEDFFSGLGPEPLDPNFTTEAFHEKLKKHSRRIKPLLLDQSFLAGLGNIYVDESLFVAGIHPETPADTLSLEQAQALLRAIRNILSRAIEAQGTTVFSFQFGDNKTGGFQKQLQVYHRGNDPCPRCGAPIQRLVVAQRGTWICPRCQPKPTFAPDP